MKKIVQKLPSKQKLNLLLLLISIAATLFIYSSSLNNELTNWDDRYYITDNENIKSLTTENIFYHFSEFQFGNYHPLTMLSLSMDYSEPLSAKSFHRTNLILHLLNTALVFLFVFLLTANNKIALITSLLFAIHPMHVESVAWVSERKDVLYTLFFLAALCTYLKYISNENKKAQWYLLTTGLFVCSLLSKGQAVVLPVILLLVDYFYGRKITLKVVTEKVPWLVLSLIFGIVAILAQNANGSIQNNEHTTVIDKLIFVGYSVAAYLYKLVLPLDLSSFYSYPVDNGSIYPPVLFYVGTLFTIALTFVVWKFFRSNKYVLFAFLFFIISISIVLKLIPLGGALMADRYTYIPYLGFFILIGKIYSDAYEKRILGLSRNMAMTLIPLALIVFSYLTFERIAIWKDSVTLWSDVISKDQTCKLAFESRGTAYLREKQYDLAISDFDKVLILLPENPPALYNRGLAFFSTYKFDRAIADFSSAIQADPGMAQAFKNRARSYYLTGNYREAWNDTLEAQKLGFPLDPQFIQYLQGKLQRK